jgi:hypothetical protein
MSEISSRPRVQSIQNLAPQALTNAGVQCMGTLVRSMMGLLSGAAGQMLSKALEGVPNSSTRSLPAMPLLRQSGKTLDATLSKLVIRNRLSAVDRERVLALVELAASPLIVQADSLRVATSKLLQAETPLQVREATRNVRQRAEQSHHHALVQALTVACSQASIKAGFNIVETSGNPMRATRVVATDLLGHSLVTEINSNPNGYPSLETELVGVADGTCHAILDAFDEALESLGVRAQESKRTFTGGVCQSAAAREFVRRKPLRAPAQQSKAIDKQNGRRVQKLNSRIPATLKGK